MLFAGSGERSTNAFVSSIAAAVAPLLFGVRLAIAVSLALFVAFYVELDMPSWAGTTAAIVSQPAVGSALLKGTFRLVGTAVGAVAAVTLTAVFPQDRLGFLFGMVVWASACSLVSTLLRNFAAYAAMLADGGRAGPVHPQVHARGRGMSSLETGFRLTRRLSRPGPLSSAEARLRAASCRQVWSGRHRAALTAMTSVLAELCCYCGGLC